MSESILSSPMMQNGELFTRPPRVVTLLAGVWTQVASSEPNRMTLSVLVSDGTASVTVSPLPYGTPSGGVVTAGGLPIQIHAAVWPLLIGGAWWARSVGATDVTILDTIQMRG